MAVDPLDGFCPRKRNVPGLIRCRVPEENDFTPGGMAEANDAVYAANEIHFGEIKRVGVIKLEKSGGGIKKFTQVENEVIRGLIMDAMDKQRVGRMGKM